MARPAYAILIISLLFLGNLAFMAFNGPIGRGGYPFIAVFVCAHILMALLWLKWPAGRRGLWAILLLAVAARALMFPFPLGDDIARYVWEGRIQNEGFNPYLVAPDSDELAHLRDDLWEGINHKPIAAIYPPGMQMIFRACAMVSDDGRFIRFVFTLLDLATVLVLLRLAALFKMDRRHVILYALNPLVLVYFAGEGHLDPVPVFLIMAALLAHRTGRAGRAFFLLGLAATAKIIPVLFLPLFLRRENLKYAPLFLLPALLVVPYLEAGSGLLDAQVQFARTFFYNGFLFSLLANVFSNYTASLLCWACLALFAAGVFFLVPDTLRACYLPAGAFLLCLPALHQWYFLWIAPFLPLFRSVPWLVLLAAASATFTTRIVQYETGGWIDYPLARVIEFAPFVVLGVYLFLKGRRTGPNTYGEPATVSVVVPTLNEAGNIAACLDSVREQGIAGVDIIVVDGGSEDGTREIVAGIDGVRLLASLPGRGKQIAAGVRKAAGDVVLVLHADSLLEPGALAAMLRRLKDAPHAAGGSFTARFDDPSAHIRLIAALDGLRAAWFGVSFGNQGQFFRREAMAGRFPEYALMEDVELSFRLKEKGSITVIRGGIKNSARRWRRTGFVGNTLTVIRLVALFVFLRRFGLIRDECRSFYRMYYGSRGRA